MKISVYIIIACFIFITACSKGDGPDGGNGNGSSPTPVPSPTASTLTLPLNNTACLSGITIDANNATITFSWQAATNAETYELVVKNLISMKQSTYTVSATTKDIVLSKNQPYSWYVVSKSSKTTTIAQSDVWKFYVAGNPTSSYAPFPATIIAPAANAVIVSGGAGQVNVVLQWEATDIDNDIASYAIYLDNKDASTLVIPSIAAKTASVSLATGKPTIGMLQLPIAPETVPSPAYILLPFSKNKGLQAEAPPCKVTRSLVLGTDQLLHAAA